MVELPPPRTVAAMATRMARGHTSSMHCAASVAVLLSPSTFTCSHTTTVNRMHCHVPALQRRTRQHTAANAGLPKNTACRRDSW